ncbi:Cytochrome P450 monooxygenase TRI13 [Colletotrichum aenigma]|uniref:Cytochrome P450 monooxygenase TRI13 n=1 Tax=Colletotrichum aenigma TaxID=1215731 RepID=UPI0018721FEB|nr:Cytochrome P450 monooxygenase TRI13 [Colletotrichum aenigma]KAF5523521.1 Cytochrome P450 monooxygenase TRI13 [Colletotrichum aenigma]
MDETKLLWGSWLLKGWTFTALSILIGFIVIRRLLLPKPLAGIPYNEKAASHVFGDIPDMMRYVLRTKRIFCWLTSLTTRHKSPIIQAFIKPGSLPWVVLTDPFESQDALLRRKEFDRSSFFGELIGGILPEQHIQFRSVDPKFKRPRNLINHLMAPTFINQVSAPEVYKSISTLIKVWQIKCEQAKGRPFLAHHDITHAALDSIFASSFGLPESQSITIQQLNAVEQSAPEILGGTDEEVVFAEGTIPELFAAVLTLTNSVTDTQLSPAPILTSWVLRKFPYMKKATAVKDGYIRDRITESVQLIEGGKTEPWSALHSVLLREREVAAKEHRKPDYYKRSIFDEFFGFMMAGHDTSATAMAWGVKYLADNPASQDHLRSALRAALPEAIREKRAPTYQELIKAQVPYLDAMVEEVLRHSGPIAFVVREALQDTTVLGRHIPKGTNVFLMANGPGYLEPNMPVDDKSRSPGARRDQNKALTGAWADDDIAAFRPERWLKHDESAKGESDGVFDPMAGPTLAFGLGPRGCFGKRLGLQTLKIEFALIVWHFQLLPLPSELNVYEGIQRFAREPTQCYVRLKNVET